MRKSERALIFGYGSLMNIASTLSTMPGAVDFRPAILKGYTRIYSLVSISRIKKGVASFSTNELAVLAARLRPSSCICGVIFSIPSAELNSYFRREARYKPVQVQVDAYLLDGAEGDVVVPINCWTVVEQSDAEYEASLPIGVSWYDEVGRYYEGQLWSSVDILPARSYLLDALRAAYEFGGERWLLNMLDETLLADGVTTVRQHIRNHPDWFPSDELECALPRAALASIFSLQG
jgi:cation transport regulator ChaC